MIFLNRFLAAACSERKDHSVLDNLREILNRHATLLIAIRRPVLRHKNSVHEQPLTVAPADFWCNAVLGRLTVSPAAIDPPITILQTR